MNYDEPPAYFSTPICDCLDDTLWPLDQTRGSCSMATTIARSLTSDFFLPMGPSQGIGVSRCNDYTNGRSCSSTCCLTDTTLL
ncbi:hypothetical protein TNCV_2938431 [Trichonephila clavipes]|nr:hypothetical protein TNCV_2938431 [Trichonephila clavipes]